MSRPHVVIIGAGFGGLAAARALQRMDVDVQVTVVDRNNFHVFQPLLYQVASAGLAADDVTFPVRAILRKGRATAFRLGHVTAIDLSARTVTIDGHDTLGYDHLVVAAGAESTSFGVPGVDEHAVALKSLDDALRLRTEVLSRFERAAAASPGAPVDLRVVIVGGGPTGVEMAGSLRELYDKVLRKDFPGLSFSGSSITVVEAADRLLTPFHPSLSARTAEALRRWGVHVELGTGVDHVEPGAVVLTDGRRLEAGVVLWAAGVAASPVGRMLGVPLGRGGRVPVEADLSLVGHPEVFVIGDLAASPTSDGRPLPQVVQPAMQGGRHVAAQIVARIQCRPGSAFAYRDKGSMATIGRNQAVADLGHGIRLHGFVGWVAWLGLHLLYLMGFRNRVTVFVNWAWNYLTYDRGSRMVVAEQPEQAVHR